MNLLGKIRRYFRRQRHISLGIKDWRANKSLCEWSRKVFGSSEGQLLLDMLQNESPMEGLLMSSASHDDRSVHLARVEGYHLCLRKLIISSTLDEEPAEPLKETWAPPE